MDHSLDALAQRLNQAKGLSDLVADAPGFLRAILHLPLVAKGDASVLVAGETGTGKELVARALHYLGPRAPYPFIPVNCGALSDTLLLSELFGHERGAFTDAKTKRVGLLEEAAGGTLFLDEIDSLPPRGQIALLRVLQDQSFRPLGSSQIRRVNVRFVSATNRRLPRIVESGEFRVDLYYRLCVFDFYIPPLRERREDVLPLADHFLRRFSEQDRLPTLSPEAQHALLTYDWPGNVRELQNALTRAIQLAGDQPIGLDHLGLPSGASSSELPESDPTRPESMTELKRQVVERFEREYLGKLMARYDGNITQAAAAAGKDRRDLGRLLKKHQLGSRRHRPDNSRVG